MRNRGSAHRFRYGIAPGDPADIVQVVNTGLPGMDPELQQERQEGGRHHVDPRNIRRGRKAWSDDPRAAAAAERQRGCQPGGAGAKDRCVAGCSGHPSHGGG